MVAVKSLGKLEDAFDDDIAALHLSTYGTCECQLRLPNLISPQLSGLNENLSADTLCEGLPRSKYYPPVGGVRGPFRTGVETLVKDLGLGC